MKENVSGCFFLNTVYIINYLSFGCEASESKIIVIGPQDDCCCVFVLFVFTSNFSQFNKTSHLSQNPVDDSLMNTW